MSLACSRLSSQTHKVARENNKLDAPALPGPFDKAGQEQICERTSVREPFNTLALMCVCFGLRISEALALKWADVDWLNGTLRVERGIVQQIVDDVKTDDSRRTLTIASDLLDVLKLWKQTTKFSAPEDWMFASPVQIGRLPWSYTGVKEELQRAAEAAGVGHLRSHAFRHTFRTWLDFVGTPVGVQQKLMRHADIRTTMNIYRDVVTDEMAKAHSKVVRMALPKDQLIST